MSNQGHHGRPDGYVPGAWRVPGDRRRERPRRGRRAWLVVGAPIIREAVLLVHFTQVGHVDTTWLCVAVALPNEDLSVLCVSDKSVPT